MRIDHISHLWVPWVHIVHFATALAIANSTLIVAHAYAPIADAGGAAESARKERSTTLIRGK